MPIQFAIQPHHRDLKPENILYKGDVYKVSDWGLTSIANLMSTSGGYVGTVVYSAPEQFDASFGGTGPWTDVWQLGVILYEMISGKLPFGTSIPVAIKNILYGDPEKLESVPSELWNLILDMLQKDPKRRPLMKDVIKRIKLLLDSYETIQVS
ncbi:MAG: protein kinase domain-containing protein [Candidatus Asgardarchaeia archaeon]